jgi:hypothetical protein
MFKITAKEKRWILKRRKATALWDKEGDLKKIKELCRSAKLTRHGRVYYNALETAALQYGKDGLQHQVLYLLSNGKWSDKAARKSLTKYGNTGKF